MQYLREWKITDAKELAKILNNKKILDQLRDSLPYPYEEKDAKKYIQTVLDMPEKEGYAWAIHINDKVIGSVGVFRKTDIYHRTAEIGYYIAEEYWGQGIVKQVLAQVCDYVFANSDIVRIYSQPFAVNKASCSVLYKAGFNYEGTMSCNVVKNGVVMDQKIYAKVKK